MHPHIFIAVQFSGISVIDIWRWIPDETDCPEDLNRFPSENWRTTGMLSYYVDEDPQQNLKSKNLSRMKELRIVHSAAWGLRYDTVR